MTIDNEAVTTGPAVDMSPEPACKRVSPVDLLSDSRDHPAPTPFDVAKKWWGWSGITHVGDCVLQDEMLMIRADGTANFFADVKSSGDDHRWVFHGGISLLDAHGVELWTSPKLIGPPTKWEHEWATWDENFNFPIVWFDSAVSARINQAHC